VPGDIVDRILAQLDHSKTRFDAVGAKRTETVLELATRLKFTRAEALIKFHETLLFLRAYPQSARVARISESLLQLFRARVQILQESGTDFSPFDNVEVSGIAGTSVTDTFSYFIVCWLLRRHPRQIEFDWEWFEEPNRLGASWPRFMPLLEEDAQVEANVPYRDWLRAARNGERELPWLINRFQSMGATIEQQAERYEGLRLYVRWKPGYSATRTGMRLPVRKLFYHKAPLIQRRDVQFREELQKSPPKLVQLDAKQSRRILDMARETSTIRYRELYGFTHGDPKHVSRVSIGRGVDIFVIGVPADRRLPLRAYHAALIFKNGVPVGYFEGLSLFERMESGFNLYYSFREGETAWIYARTLNIFHHLLGVTAFSIDPYQIGYENEEGIESGAFWFYRKLGFRPTRPGLLKLAVSEEKKISQRPSYRTSARILRKLAEGPMIFELDQVRTGEWDRFQLREIGFAVQRLMASRFKGDAGRMRNDSVMAIARMLTLPTSSLPEYKSRILSDFAVVLALIPGLDGWNDSEKTMLSEVIRAKGGVDEVRYLKLMQRHARLRQEIIRLGSK